MYLERSDTMVCLTLKEYLDKRGISRYALHKQSEINYQIIDNYYKNRVVRYDSDVLDRMCQTLQCDISDLIRFTPKNP